jgi:hypothetical protein
MDLPAPFPHDFGISPFTLNEALWRGNLNPVRPTWALLNAPWFPLGPCAERTLRLHGSCLPVRLETIEQHARKGGRTKLDGPTSPWEVQRESS